MNIACLIRGPIRPNCQTVINNINLFLESFKNFEANIDLYLCTWKEYSEHFSTIKQHFKNIKIVSATLTKQPIFTTSNSQKVYGFNRTNCYKQFVLAKYCINTVSNLNEYNFLVHSRTDMEIKIKPEQWLNHDFYTTIHTMQEPINNSYFTNDQFSIAHPSLMKKAWHYEDESELIDLINAVPFPEKILDFNIQKNNIYTKTASPLIWRLNAERHIT